MSLKAGRWKFMRTVDSIQGDTQLLFFYFFLINPFYNRDKTFFHIHDGLDSSTTVLD